MAQGKHLAEKEPKKGKLSDKEQKTEKGKLGNKKFWITANIVVTVSLFICITVSLIVFERPTHSDIERRDLAEFPEFSAESFFSGDFTGKVSTWFNDTVPWRDGFKNIYTKMMNFTGISSGGIGHIVLPDPPKPNDNQNNPAATTAAEPEQTDNPNQTSQSEGQTDTPSVTDSTGTASTETAAEPATQPPTPGIDGAGGDGVASNGQYIYEYQGHVWGVSLYGGGYNQKLYAESVNKFAEDLDGIAKVYSMIPPTNGDFYTPVEVLNADPPVTHLQKPDIDEINSMLSDKVTVVDCYSALQQHTDEYIYLRTDHHWTPLGAYYASQEFAKAADVPFLELNEENFEYRQVEDVVGSLYGYAQGSAGGAMLLSDPDTFIYYVPNNDFKTYYYTTSFTDGFQYPFFQTDQLGGNAYGTFMGADNKIVKVETDVKNGRKLLIFKDSYGNAEPPFYMNSFEEIYVCDTRFFALNAIDFIKEQGVTDVLFTMNIFSAAGDNSESIEVNRLGNGPWLNW